MNTISLRYIESIYNVYYKSDEYKLTLIEDLENGDVEVIVFKYNKRGEPIEPTEKQRNSVIKYFNEHNY